MLERRNLTESSAPCYLHSCLNYVYQSWRTFFVKLSNANSWRCLAFHKQNLSFKLGQLKVCVARGGSGKFSRVECRGLNTGRKELLLASTRHLILPPYKQIRNYTNAQSLSCLVSREHAMLRLNTQRFTKFCSSVKWINSC